MGAVVIHGRVRAACSDGKARMARLLVDPLTAGDRAAVVSVDGCTVRGHVRDAADGSPVFLGLGRNAALTGDRI